LITIGDMKRMQEALDGALSGDVFLRKALHEVLRSKSFSIEERAWVRDTLYQCVQLKNRYWTLIKEFEAAHPGQESFEQDIRLFIVARYLERETHSAIDEEVFRELRPKSRPRKFLEFLKSVRTEALFPSPRTHLKEYLWLYQSHPLWIVRKWLGNLSADEAGRLCEFNNSLGEVTLRVNPLQGSRDALLEQLRTQGHGGRATDGSPFGIRLGRRFDPLTHPGYKAGRFTTQSLSSQLVCLYLNPKPGLRVLDYCAGEGGKTLLLAHLMGNRGEIHAHDKEAWRLRNLQLRARKEGLGNVRLGGLRAIRQAEGQFDQVLLDVPCSGSGNFRQQPELKWKLTPEQVTELQTLQLQLLAEAAPFAKPNGHVFYVTCSLFGEENHKVVRRFIYDHPEWKVVTVADYLRTHHQKGFWVQAEELARFAEGPYFQIHPARHELSGMFCAILTR